MINTEEKVYLKDKIATKIFSAPECRDYLLKIISAALDIDFEYLKEGYEALDIRIGTNINTINSESDILGKTDRCFVSLEINYNHSKRLDNKNMTYVCQLILRQLDKSEQYKNLLPINQICLNNYDRFGKKKFIYHSSIMEEKLHIQRSDLINIVDINIDFLNNLGYNEIVNISDDSLEKLLYIFVCDNNNLLDKIYLNNKIIDSVRRKLLNLSKDLDEYLYYDKDEIMRLDAYDLAKKESAIEMLKDNVSIEKICKYTKLSPEEVKEFQESIDE